MSSSHADIETAERLSRKRARVWPGLAVIFMAQQASFFSSAPPADLSRTVDQVKIGAWLVLSAVMVLALWTGGYWFYRREVRILINDEVAKAHRADALSRSFLASMVAALLLYLVATAVPIALREAIHIIVSAGVVVALLRFSVLERRAHG